MTCRTAVANDNNLVSQRQFWEAKVNKMIQNFEYGRITMEELVNELALMGYETVSYTHLTLPTIYSV